MLQNIEHIESLGWFFIRKELVCNTYSGRFYGNDYLMKIYSDNKIKIFIVHYLNDNVCKHLEKENFEYVLIFNGSCNSLESLIHVCTEIIVPIDKAKKVKGNREKDSNLFKPKSTNGSNN